MIFGKFQIRQIRQVLNSGVRDAIVLLVAATDVERSQLGQHRNCEREKKPRERNKGSHTTSVSDEIVVGEREGSQIRQSQNAAVDDALVVIQLQLTQIGQG